MKRSILLPAITGILGFSLAWVLKPDATVPAKSAKADPAAITKSETRLATQTERPQQSRTVKKDDPLHPLPTYSAASADDAKMLRLTEILGLSEDQRKRLRSAIDEVIAAQPTSDNLLADTIARGNALESAIAGILTAEQMEKFEQLRRRERENRTDVQAQKTLTDAMGNIDLNADQRQQALSRLRVYIQEKMQSIPNSAALLIENSILPVGDQPLTAEGLMVISDAQSSTVNSGDDVAAFHQKLLEKNRRGTERLLECFDGILTPGQMVQYQLTLSKQQQLLESLPR